MKRTQDTAIMFWITLGLRREVNRSTTMGKGRGKRRMGEGGTVQGRSEHLQGICGDLQLHRSGLPGHPVPDQAVQQGDGQADHGLLENVEEDGEIFGGKT